MREQDSFQKQYPQLSPKQAVALTVLESAEVMAAEPGVYVAWLVAPSAVANVGLDDQPPIPLYVGRSITRGGLRQRVRQHICSGFLDLVEMLALQGVVVAPLGARFLPAALDTSADIGELAELSFEETCRWQHQNVHWSWLVRDPRAATLLEIELIKQLSPLLNRSHLSAFPPPQLRGSFDQVSRARWLWQMSWAGLLIGQKVWRLPAADQRRWQLESAEASYGVDELGYPLSNPEAGGAAIGNAPPDAHDLWNDIRTAAREAPPRIRQALGVGAKDETLWAYWAAHAASEQLPDPVPFVDALAQTFCAIPAHDAAGPRRLPAEPERREELWKLTTLLDHPRH